MSFSFSFDLDAAEIDHEIDIPTESLKQLDLEDDKHPQNIVPHANVPLPELLATLPPLLSYTPVFVPLASTSTSTSPRSVTILRRDLFDARFQILNQDEQRREQQQAESTTTTTTKEVKKGEGEEEELFIDERTDLVKGVYEGGLKTWECSLDLIDCLHQRGYSTDEDEGLEEDKVRGKSILEVGCGTALPSCAIFLRLLKEIARDPTPEGSISERKTKFHLQDYNKQVLTLITLPNLLLTYAYHLSTSQPHLFSSPDSDDEIPSDPSSTSPLPTPKISRQTLTFQHPGELDVSPELLESFENLLERESIELKFSQGEWKGMDQIVREEEEEGYDLVLTSETVYSLGSLESLLDLLQASIKKKEKEEGMEGTICLVACKRLYFGVGGGELEFRRRVEQRGGTVESVWGEGTGKGKSEGVGRTVMKVEFA